MAILTVQQLLVAARIITDATDVPAQTLAVANALYPGCVALINQYAPMASDDVKNLALERLFGWMWESDVQSGDVSDPLQASGALSLLSPHSPGRWQRELSTAASLPAITGFAVGDIVNLAGVLYELVADTTDANVHHGIVADQAGSLVGDAVFQWEGVSPFNIRFAANKTAIGSSPPTNLWAEFSDSEGQTVEIQLTYSPGANTATTYAYHRTPSGTAIDTASIGATFSVAFYTDESRTAPQAIHPANRWERVNRQLPVINPIALADSADRWPKTKVPSDTVYTADLPHTPGILTFNEIFPSFTLTATSSDQVIQAPNYFSPTIDLDTYAHGEFHCSLEISITPVSDVNMGFVRNKSNQTEEDRHLALSTILFASDLSEEDDWGSTSPENENGLTAFEVPVYSANTTAGTYYLLLVHNSNNEVGAYYHWDGQAGATGATITAELRVTFTPSDAPAATPTVRNNRGALQAQTGNLPSSIPQANLTSAQLGWTLATGASITLTSAGFPKPPYLRPAPNVIGWWFVFKRGGVEFSESIQPFAEQAGYRFEVHTGGSRDHSLLISYVFDGSWNVAGERAFTVPANSTIEIYLGVS